MSMKSILLPIDGSAESLCATETALSVATATGAKVTAESVVDSGTLWKLIGSNAAGLIGSGPYMAAREALVDALKAGSDALLLSFEVRANMQNVRAESLLDEGNLIDQITKRAKGYDLVIMGHNQHRHHETGEDEYVTRESICERLSKLCPSPLLLIQRHGAHWEHARLAVNKNTAVKSVIDKFLLLCRGLELSPEIYSVCLDSEQSGLARQIGRLVQDGTQVRIITRDPNECDEAWECAQDVHGNTLLVVTTEEKDGERKTCGGTELDTLVRELKLPGVLIMPPQPTTY